MARELSASALKAAFERNSGETWLCLVEIAHDSLPAPIRLANNTQDVTSNGDTYLKCHFQVVLPDDSERVPKVTLRIVNVAREQTQWIREITGEPTVSLFFVLASQPDTVDIGPYVMQLKSVSWDAIWIEGELGMESFLAEPLVGWSITPENFPSMY